MPVVKIKPKEKIRVSISVPGDKSITHRAVIFASMAEGRAEIFNYLDSDDCRRTIEAFRQMGVSITKSKKNLIVESKGINGLTAPGKAINAGNSGTTARLLAGVLAGRPFESEITGDESLSKRPMKRVMDPLEKMEVKIEARDGQYLPMKIIGNAGLKPINYEMPVASAQVKSCVLLAGMQATGATTVRESNPTRDHTERMLEFFGARTKSGENSFTLEGPVSFKSKDIAVPGDFSSAAFFLTAGILLPDSEVEIADVGLNIRRVGLLNVFARMGAKFSIKNVPPQCNEPVGSVTSRTSHLHAVEFDPKMIPLMIDELPLIALAATQAEGKTEISGANELRFKESDRIKTVAEGLIKMGAKITEKSDGMIIEGPVKLKGAKVNSHKDHRIAMMLAIAGLCAEGETTISDSECVDISFPGFWGIISKW